MRQIITIVFCACMLYACNFIDGERIKGNGNITTEQRSQTNFTQVSAAGHFNILVKQQSGFSVKVEADENLLPYIVTRVQGNELHIETKDGYNVQSDAGIKVYVGAPAYTAISLAGSGNIETENTLDAGKIRFDMSGSGNVIAHINAKEVSSNLSGSGNMALSGTTQDFETSVAGSGNIQCYGLTAENVKIDIAGSGNGEVYASKKLKAHVAGSGDIFYKGAANAEIDVAGSGKVSKAE